MRTATIQIECGATPVLGSISDQSGDEQNWPIRVITPTIGQRGYARLQQKAVIWRSRDGEPAVEIAEAAGNSEDADRATGSSASAMRCLLETSTMWHVRGVARITPGIQSRVCEATPPGSHLIHASAVTLYGPASSENGTIRYATESVRRNYLQLLRKGSCGVKALLLHVGSVKARRRPFRPIIVWVY